MDRLAIEASSHGLDQYRLDGVQIAAAAFTNVSRDHLDYHGTMGAYLSAKLRLFSELVVGAALPLFAPMPLTPFGPRSRAREGVARADLWPARRRPANSITRAS